jgi:hypothetical protein
MTTNVSQIGQYVRGLVKGRPLGIISVTEFGAVGDGDANDTAAIQAAIDAAQAAFDAGPVTVANRISQSPAVYFPEGTYKTMATLHVGRQLRLFGSGYMSSIIKGTADEPIFEVNVTSYREYAAATFEHLAICGDSGNVADKEDQHGIKVLYTQSGQDATLDLRFCAIEFCGGHGVYFSDNANTPRILGNLIQTNWLDGINFCGGSEHTPSFATNARILHNVIRENRRGVVYDGEAAVDNAGSKFLYSGHIAYNLFENNTNGTGQVGSTARPAQGVVLLNTRSVFVESNYFELHLQHVHIGVAGFQASAYCQVARNQFYGVSAVPGRFPGFGGPAQKPCDIALASGSLVGIVCRDNVHEIPNRPLEPVETSIMDWSGGAWGDTLPIFAIIDGEQHILDEGWRNGASIATADAPVFRRLADLGQESFGITTGGPGLVVSPLDGVFPAGSWVAVTGQITPYDVAGRSQIRFNRRTDGGGFVSVHANNSAQLSQEVAQFLGQEQKLQAVSFGSNNASVTVPTGAATSIYAFPNGDAAYFVWAYVDSGNAASYGAFAIVVTDGGTARIAVAGNATLHTLSMSGLNLRSTQTSGATQTVKVAVMKMV